MYGWVGMGLMNVFRVSYFDDGEYEYEYEDEDEGDEKRWA
jgi:hypothetical protein